ncbi:MAG: lipid-binding SYLF domain-containing protein [Steroidobacter sp.]
MRITSIFLACVSIALSTPVWADKYSDAINNFRKAEITRPYFTSAYGYAVFPTIGKGAIGVGGAAGKGHVYQGGKFVGESTLVQLSVGFQLGGQAYSQIIFFQDKRAFDEFTSDSFEFGADASAVAITLGANAQAGTTGISASVSTNVEHGKTVAQYYKGFAVLTLAKGGLMYQAALAGQKYVFKRK